MAAFGSNKMYSDSHQKRSVVAHHQGGESYSRLTPTPDSLSTPQRFTPSTPIDHLRIISGAATQRVADLNQTDECLNQKELPSKWSLFCCCKICCMPRNVFCKLCCSFLLDFGQALQWLNTTFRLRQALPLILLAGYSFLGAFIFYSSEHEAELEMLQKRTTEANKSFMESEQALAKWRLQVIERIWEIHTEASATGKKERFLDKSSQAFDFYESQLRASCYKRLIYDQAIKAEAEPQWDFWGALFYAGTIYTTIGYGSIVPVTNSGRCLTIGYAVFGVPMLVVILHKLGGIFCSVIQKFWNFMLNFCDAFHCCRRRRSRRRQQASDATNLEEGQDLEAGYDSISESPSPTIQLYDVPFTLALAITLTWMLLCSGIFLLWEKDWDYFNSFYFFFTSLTTIGLGDVVPKQLDYMIMNFGLVIIGLSLVTMCINIVQVKMEHFLEEMMIMIQKKYQDAQVEGEGADMGEADQGMGLPSVSTKMPHSKWMLKFMGDKQKETLMHEWTQKAKMKVKGTQTDRLAANKSTQTSVPGQPERRPITFEPLRLIMPGASYPSAGSEAATSAGEEQGQAAAAAGHLANARIDLEKAADLFPLVGAPPMRPEAAAATAAAAAAQHGSDQLPTMLQTVDEVDEETTSGEFSLASRGAFRHQLPSLPDILEREGNVQQGMPASSSSRELLPCTIKDDRRRIVYTDDFKRLLFSISDLLDDCRTIIHNKPAPPPDIFEYQQHNEAVFAMAHAESKGTSIADSKDLRMRKISANAEIKSQEAQSPTWPGTAINGGARIPADSTCSSSNTTTGYRSWQSGLDKYNMFS